MSQVVPETDRIAKPPRFSRGVVGNVVFRIALLLAFAVWTYFHPVFDGIYSLGLLLIGGALLLFVWIIERVAQGARRL